MQGLLSAQSASLRQQPATTAFAHAPVATLQVSVVQTSESLQSTPLVQQPATAA